MPVRRSLALISLVAALHGLFFIWYQQPDWLTQYPDQDGYRQLARGLVASGTFTRVPNAPEFVPEVVRTPAYPMFVALVYRVFGQSQAAVALTQTALFVGICVLVYLLGRRIVRNSLALIAALVTALYPPIPYFGALVMTEVWTTALFTLAMLLAVRAWNERRLAPFVWLGAVLAVTTLSRPVFVLFPFMLIAVAVAARVWALTPRPRAAQWSAMLAAFAVVMLPWFLYNYVNLGVFTLSPAGGIGRGLWEGSWQAEWSGRVQNELTHIADETDDPATLDARVRAVAEREHVPVERMLEYVHQWKDIRLIWTQPVDSAERARARVRADQEYRGVAIENIRHDSAAHLTKRLARGVFILWAGEIPFRYSEINRMSPRVIYACWATQAVLILVALYGLVVLVRAGRRVDALLLASPIVYITAVHFPLLTEARQALPAMPVVLLLATIGTYGLLSREPKIHEREHL
jgi:4-amino-4-deoxy-L-arabinose transferase-like glycosyltransferase